MSAQSSTATVQPAPESPSSPEPEADELPLDVVFDLLSNERRRRTLWYLIDGPETATLGDLAEHIASIENDKSVQALSSTERKRVYICLYQCHLPRMDDAGVIEFDENRKTIEVGENVEFVTRFLPAQDGADSSEGGWSTAFANAARALDRRLRTWTTS